MGDQDDIEQNRWMQFVARKVGTRQWHVSRAPGLKGKKQGAVSQEQLDLWRREFEEAHQ